MEVDVVAHLGAERPGVRRHQGRTGEVDRAELVHQPLGEPQAQVHPATAWVVAGLDAAQQEPGAQGAHRHASRREDQEQHPDDHPGPGHRGQPGEAADGGQQVAAGEDPRQPPESGDQTERDGEDGLADLGLRRGRPHPAIGLDLGRGHPVEHRGEGPHGGVLVEVGDGDLRVLLPQSGHHLRGGEAATTEVEEVVTGPAHHGAEHVQPELGHPGRRTRQRGCGACAVCRRAGERPGQGVAVDLPGRAGGEVVDRGQPRHQSRGQGLPEAFAGGDRVEPVVDRDVTDQQLVACPAGPDGGGGTHHAREAEQGTVDLAELDASTAELDLVVGAAREDQPGAVETHPVPAAVGTLPAERRHRAVLLRVLGRIEVPRQPDPADDQLPRLPVGDRSPVSVDHGEVPPVQRETDADRFAGFQEGAARHDRGLRGSVGVPDLAAAARKPFTDLRRARLAAHDQQPHLVQRLRRPERDQRRDRRHDGDVVRHQPRPDVDAAAHQGPRSRHEARSVGPGQPHLLARRVEGDGQTRHHPVVLADRALLQEQPRLRVHERRCRAVCHRHALRGPGGAGGEDDPGVVRRLDVLRKWRLLPALGRASRRDHQAVAHHRSDVRLVEHEASALVGVVGVDRDVGGPRDEHAHDRDVQVDRARLDPDSYLVAPGDAVSAQIGGELVGRLLELGVGQDLDAVVHRGGLGRPLHRGTEDVDQRPARRGPIGTAQRHVTSFQGPRRVGHQHSLPSHDERKVHGRLRGRPRRPSDPRIQSVPPWFPLGRSGFNPALHGRGPEGDETAATTPRRRSVMERDEVPL